MIDPRLQANKDVPTEASTIPLWASRRFLLTSFRVWHLLCGHWCRQCLLLLPPLQMTNPTVGLVCIRPWANLKAWLAGWHYMAVVYMSEMHHLPTPDGLYTADGPFNFNPSDPHKLSFRFGQGSRLEAWGLRGGRVDRTKGLFPFGYSGLIRTSMAKLTKSRRLDRNMGFRLSSLACFTGTRGMPITASGLHLTRCATSGSGSSAVALASSSPSFMF
ncbi:hypothetical protein V8F06_003229 [Rhypophila decipiens]